MNKIIAMIAAIGLALMPTMSYAQDGCLTKEEVISIVEQSVPTADLKFEGQNILVFSAPEKPTNLVITFDGEGCAASQHEMAKAPNS